MEKSFDDHEVQISMDSKDLHVTYVNYTPYTWNNSEAIRKGYEGERKKKKKAYNQLRNYFCLGGRGV